MYIPSHFKQEDLDEVRNFIKANSFGILITVGNGKIWGSHIPLELEEDPEGNEVIYGHISKANHQLEDVVAGEDEVMIIYNGPHAYVSSSWYGHENVPTWNYIAVHVYGRLSIIDESEVTYALNKLMNKYESSMKNPVKLSSLSKSTMRQVKGVIGFKIQINEIQAAYKLSQNRNQEDYHAIVDELKDSPNDLDKQTASVMRKQSVFKKP